MLGRAISAHQMRFVSLQQAPCLLTGSMRNPVPVVKPLNSLGMEPVTRHA